MHAWSHTHALPIHHPPILSFWVFTFIRLCMLLRVKTWKKPMNPPSPPTPPACTLHIFGLPWNKQLSLFFCFFGFVPCVCHYSILNSWPLVHICSPLSSVSGVWPPVSSQWHRSQSPSCAPVWTLAPHPLPITVLGSPSPRLPPGTSVSWGHSFLVLGSLACVGVVPPAQWYSVLGCDLGWPREF